MPLPPRLETARLILRPLGWDDLDALAELHAEASFWWYPKQRALGAEETREFIERVLQRYDADGVCTSAAVVKATGELAGWLGLAVPHFLPEILPAVEVGWRLGERFRGCGYATEGAAEAIRYGFDVLGLDRVVSIFEPANAASGRVMDKLGFEFERETYAPATGELLHVRQLTRAKWSVRNILGRSFAPQGPKFGQDRTTPRALARRRRSFPLSRNLTTVDADERRTDDGIPIQTVYTPQDLTGWDPDTRLGQPGQPPYTRGVYPNMYRGRPWTMRQYSGFGTAEATNRRWKMLLANGSTGLSCAFDLPTQMGYDSDHPRAEGEVGKVGVAIDTIDDMHQLLDGLPLDQVTTSMTINSTAAILLLLYQLVAEERGIAPEKLGGTIQNDILKEYVARGTYIYPPRQSMRLVTDLFAYCRQQVPNWNTISISGYHIREAGSTAVQEVAFTLANGIAYVEAAIAAGLAVDEFAARLSFFWNAHNNLFEEVAKFRAARRMWAKIMTERFGATDDRSKLLRFHTQTGGSTLTAQQPENNVVRVTLQALSAVLGGTQSLHANGFDEAVGLPTERAARLALRTQQIIASESGVVDTVDPLAGSYFVESLTEAVEARAWEYLDKIDGLGGAVAAIEAGFMTEEIERAAFAYAQAVDDGTKVVVGVNSYVDDEAQPLEVFPHDPDLEARKAEELARFRAERDQQAVDAALEGVAAAARGTQNLLVPMKEALARRATLGEVSDVLRQAFGVYRPAS